MRDYALTRAQSAEAAGSASLISRVIGRWRARRAVARLADYDDHMLRDIGITRAEVNWAASLPLTVNAALALEDRSRERRLTQRKHLFD